jgi:hypothetical protein
MVTGGALGTLTYGDSVHRDGATVATGAEETQSLVARLPAEAKIAVGERLRLSADPDALHVFDPTTTRRLD